ncbi:MAG: hypothetical protein DMG75_04590 [Acidobacteria bacterium]|nr:MAG: hypothetical protein DMG75_04590 [Acidobacteriota bacterium]
MEKVFPDGGGAPELEPPAADWLTVMVTGVVAEPPQLSHSWTVVLYVPGVSDKLVFSFAPLTLKARVPELVNTPMEATPLEQAVVADAM